MADLTHLNEKNNPKMVDVSQKDSTTRVAIATGKISMSKEAYEAVKNASGKKGSVLQTAIIAAVMGAKKTSDIIPMCHPLFISSVDCDIEELEDESAFKVECRVKTEGKTGVEMEALTATSTALLTIYDMVKAIDKSMVIGDILLEHKSGGKSGIYKRGS